MEQNKKAKVVNSENISLKELDKLISEKPNNDRLYLLRAEIYVQQNELAKALNDYDKVLEFDPENKQAATKKEIIKTILRFNNTDIYANPNTDMDPWLE